jgi:hypothetical protein
MISTSKPANRCAIMRASPKPNRSTALPESWQHAARSCGRNQYPHAACGQRVRGGDRLRASASARARTPRRRSRRRRSTRSHVPQALYRGRTCPCQAPFVQQFSRGSARIISSSTTMVVRMKSASATISRKVRRLGEFDREAKRKFRAALVTHLNVHHIEEGNLVGHTALHALVIS